MISKICHDPNHKESKYWSCTVDLHRHRTEAVATRCIAKHTKTKQPIHVRWTKDARLALFEELLNGYSLSELAERHSVSRGLIQHLSWRARNELARQAGVGANYLGKSRVDADFWRDQIKIARAKPVVEPGNDD